MFLFACGAKTMLDQPFNRETYDDDLLFMLQKQQVSQDELFDIVYAIVRRREYFNYEIEGKTYREILSMARDFRRDGLPVREVFNRNGEQEAVVVEVENEGAAFVRKPGSKTRLEKKLKFAAEYVNQSDKPVVLLSTTFHFNGPFHDHLSHSAYQLNCLLEPGQRKRINFIAEAANIRDNLIFGSAFDVRLLSVDSLFSNLTITVGGNSITQDTRYHDACRFGSARVDPARDYLMKDEFNAEEQIERDQNGRATAIRMGNAHFQISDSDEILQLR